MFPVRMPYGKDIHNLFYIYRYTTATNLSTVCRGNNDCESSGGFGGGVPRGPGPHLYDKKQ